MTKAEVIAEIARQTGMDRTDVQAAVESFFEVVKENVTNGENIYVRGFGSFVSKKRARKTARDILKNTAIVIDEHYVPSFKPAKIFVDQVKKGSADDKPPLKAKATLVVGARGLTVSPLS